MTRRTVSNFDKQLRVTVFHIPTSCVLVVGLGKTAQSEYLMCIKLSLKQRRSEICDTVSGIGNDSQTNVF